MIRADGTLGWTHSRAVPILDEAGNIIEWFGTASDVTRRKQAEEDLKDIRSRMEAALEAGAIGTWVWDVQGDRFFGDASLAHIFGVATWRPSRAGRWLASSKPSTRTTGRGSASSCRRLSSQETGTRPTTGSRGPAGRFGG